MKKKTLGIILASAILGTSVSAVAFGNASLNIAGAPESNVEETVSLPSDWETIGTTDLVKPVSTMDELMGDEETPAFSYTNVADIAEAAMPSIVAITATSVQEINSFFYRDSFEYEATSAGSGIIVGSNDTELLICTNNHVVEGSDDLSVTFFDDESYPAYTKGTDAANDLAVVSVLLSDISDDTMNQIKIARIGDSEKMRVGEQVVAIGNALGYGQSVTTGIISAKERSIKASDEKSYEDYYRNFNAGSNDDATTYENLIQTDAAINFGNSGGALLNMNGELIGINSAKAASTGVEGMGYAIPISAAMPILERLMTTETRIKLSEDQIGYIGINGESVSRDATLLYGIPEGIYVTVVAEGSPAEQAGLEAGSIITAFDGETVSSMRDLQYMLQYYAAGETVDMTVCSKDTGYNEKTLSITLGDRSEIQ